MVSHSYRCQLCGATFVCKANETDQLLRHANDVHPNVIGQFTIEGEILDAEDAGDLKRPICARWTLVLPTPSNKKKSKKRSRNTFTTNNKSQLSCTCGSQGTLSVVTTGGGGEAASYIDSCSYTYSGSYVCESPTFWTTVETWRPGPSRIPCPNCGIVARPVVRRQKRRVSSSLPGALCVLTCWPICFLPFMSGHGRLGSMKLYCASCDHFIAIFDPDSETFARPPLCKCDVTQDTPTIN